MEGRRILALACTVIVALLFLLPPCAHAELAAIDGVSAIAKSGTMGATTGPSGVSE
ncbi:unnamed protein product, partial [Closterium sp. NIES-53]